MTDDSTFDPFELKKTAAPPVTDSKPRPVLIAVSQGNAAETPHARAVGPTDSSEQSTFDPFGISAVAVTPQDVGTTRPAPDSPPDVPRVYRSPSIALPPKLIVKLTKYEEVSSVAKTGPDAEGSSHVSIEGSVYAQVQCSDALKNAPFSIISVSSQAFKAGVRPNPKYTVLSEGDIPVITIPKQEIGFVPVMFYSLNDVVQHMPILLERKVTVNERSIRVAVQVRSKLTNVGDLEDFTIAVAVPERVDGQSIKIIRGDGVWDELKRCIRWKLASLKKGNSFMVSAQASLWQPLPEAEQICFPILMRCKSATDQISKVDFDVVEAPDYPSSLIATKAQSFRLLHRLT
jgi:hypothetical protein